MQKVVNGVLMDMTQDELAQVALDAAEYEARATNTVIDARILALEASVTQRRLREAALTEAGRAWLADVDAQIAVLRAERV